ncbi:MAG TPA: DUF6113 family protein [Jiangellales bacterium]|nr:DUF6113 family protein [Jiangellales bacterium]
MRRPAARPAGRSPARAAAVAALVPVAVAAAVCACFTHAGTVTLATLRLPAGLLVALAGSAGVLALGTLLARSRWGSGAVATAWVLTVVLLSLPRPEGDVVVAGDVVGLTFLGVGVALAGLAVGVPAGGLGYHGQSAAVSPHDPRPR